MKRKHSQSPKVTRPSVFKVFQRKRLFRSIDSGLKRNGIWVYGPAGAGKTTLVNSHIESRKIPCLWYQVDEGDTDLSSFFHFLSIGALSCLRKSNKPLPVLTPEYLSSVTTFARNYFRDFFGRAPSPFVLVLDNFQEASADRMFLDVISEGLKEAPEGCAIIFISRTEPPAVFARDLANRNFWVIGWEDIRFTDTESSAMAKVLGYKQSYRDLSRLNDMVNGWAAGLLLMLERMRTGKTLEKDLKRLAGESVFNYFMEEVLSEADDEKRDFLEKTAFLPDMTLKMAESISGNEKSLEILNELNSRQFFINRRAQNEDVYQYHPLFREFLLERVVESYSKEAIAELKSTAAKILLESGRTEEAANLFLDASDLDGLERLILDSAKTLAEQGRLQLLESWIKALPDEMIVRSPWMLYYSGLCRLSFNPAESRSRFEAAYALFKAAGDASGTFLSWSMIVDTYLYEWKDFKPLDRWIEEFESLTGQYGEYPSREVEERAAVCMFGALMFSQPHNPKLHYWVERVNGIMHGSTNVTRRLSIGRNLVLYYLWMGYVTKAEAVMELLSSAAKAPGIQPLPLLMFLRSSVLCNFYSASHKKAIELIEQGLALAEKTGVHLMDTMFWGQGIYNSVPIGEIERAESFFNRIVSSFTNRRCYETAYYHHQASIIAFYRGDIASAKEHGETALMLSEQGGAPFLTIPALYIFLNAKLEAGDTDTDGLLASLKKIAEETKSRLAEYTLLIVDMLIAMKSHDEALALERLGMVIALGKAYGLKFMPFFKPESLVSVFAKALDAGLETEAVKELIKVNNLCSYIPESYAEAWPWPLKIYTLGRFELYRDGKRIEFQGKVQHKPLALLKAIIAMGGNNVSDAEIIDELWPDSDGDMSYRAFATTLHRLRKLLSDDKAVRYREGLLTLDDGLCWVDVWCFDRLVKQADAGSKGAFERIEKAITLYKGPFLAGEDIPCVTSFRERLKSKFVRQVGLLSRHLEDKGEHEKAVELYGKGIVADELAEKFYQGIMRCCKLMGDRVKGLKTYNLCKSVLSKELMVEPSKETEAIYRSLVAD